MCSLPVIMILIIIVCGILLWFGIDGLRKNRVKDDGGEFICLEKSPVNYWVTVSIYIGLGIGGIIFCFFL